MLQGLGRGESIIDCGRAERRALLSPPRAGWLVNSTPPWSCPSMRRPGLGRHQGETGRSGQVDMENRGDEGAETGDELDGGGVDEEDDEQGGLGYGGG